jgi:hypothetical protein
MPLCIFQDEPTLGHLEFPSNFEQFDKPKTIANVVEWINDSIKATQTLHSDYNQFGAGGAHNAIGSVAELEAQNQMSHSNDIEVTTCVAHQNEQAGPFASGLGDFVEPVNAELGNTLKKSHGIQVRLIECLFFL